MADERAEFVGWAVAVLGSTATAAGKAWDAMGEAQRSDYARGLAGIRQFNRELQADAERWFAERAEREAHGTQH